MMPYKDCAASAWIEAKESVLLPEGTWRLMNIKNWITQRSLAPCVCLPVETGGY